MSEEQPSVSGTSHKPVVLSFCRSIVLSRFTVFLVLCLSLIFDRLSYEVVRAPRPPCGSYSACMINEVFGRTDNGGAIIRFPALETQSPTSASYFYTEFRRIFGHMQQPCKFSTNTRQPPTDTRTHPRFLRLEKEPGFQSGPGDSADAD